MAKELFQIGCFETFIRIEIGYFSETSKDYDIKSVMQYHGTAFSSNGQATMIDRSTNRPIPWNTRITQNDFDQVLYNLFYTPI